MIDEVNAPLKRKANIVQAEMPNPKRARNEPSEKKSKPKLQKPKLEQAKPAPKYKQPKMSDFFKKFETSKLPAFSNGKKTLINMFSNDVYYRKIFWFRCCLRTKYDGIFWEVLISRRFLQNPTDTPPLSKDEKTRQGGGICS